MPGDDKQRLAFDFFEARFASSEPFTPKELQDYTGWGKDGTFSTHWGKWFVHLSRPIGDGTFHVSERFRRYSAWEKFKAYVSQTRPSPVYTPVEHKHVRIYEFFMPLAHEIHLRAALDDLFYKDPILRRLKLLTLFPLDEMRKHFPFVGDPPSAADFEQICKFVSDHFQGYSIYHVNGRFRAGELKTVEDVGANHRSYLADETSAVTRFVFPCNSPQELGQIDFLFTHLFAEPIVEYVGMEDEIWLVETGHVNRLRVWKKGK